MILMLCFFHITIFNWFIFLLALLVFVFLKIYRNNKKKKIIFCLAFPENKQKKLKYYFFYLFLTLHLSPALKRCPCGLVPALSSAALFVLVPKLLQAQTSKFKAIVIVSPKQEN